MVRRDPSLSVSSVASVKTLNRSVTVGVFEIFFPDSDPMSNDSATQHPRDRGRRRIRKKLATTCSNSVSSLAAEALIRFEAVGGFRVV